MRELGASLWRSIVTLLNTLEEGSEEGYEFTPAEIDSTPVESEERVEHNHASSPTGHCDEITGPQPDSSHPNSEEDACETESTAGTHIDDAPGGPSKNGSSGLTCLDSQSIDTPFYPFYIYIK
ncbi:hypothetical protein GCM10011571_00270 [Marinithermofilum abyssi]|uniref:Uncharacterized protein n=1 Tax=Marinithermofilum abyssi TaxID=1571185 RepID=A0A8J2VC61_9BACL|nr:hypothetical protein [Marinithermofilum abyssi]GGE03368.1 hypothetical protein GCM10011571_00270 [Marinithermofilum abyssi]